MSYTNKEQAIDLIESMIADKGVAFNPHKLAMALKDMESVEIVRCKDCIHCADDWNGNEPMFTCELARCCESVYPDDFCSYGEKQVTGKLESVEKATSEGEESTMGQPKSKLESDTISRQAAIEAMAPFDANHELRDTLESLPPVEPKLVSGDTISKEALIQSFLADCECKDRSEAKAVTCSLDTMLELIDDAPPSEPKPVCEDAISRKWVLNEIITKVENDDSLTDEQKGSLSVAKYIIRHAPPVEPKRPKGEWVSCSEPPKDRRNVFLAHGTNDFKSCCIGHYEQGMGWYEDRNFFAKPIYDCKYWCDIPELPNIGDNQFGMGVSAEI